jgi:hypothetical protein
MGCLIFIYIWINLRWPVKICKGIWVALKVSWGAIKTSGFKKAQLFINVPAEKNNRE